MEDNSFADITFDKLYVEGIKGLSNKAFDKAAKTVEYMNIHYLSAIKNTPPKHHVWKSISQLTKLKVLSIRLNISQIPSLAIIPVDGHKSALEYLAIDNRHNLTLKSDAFGHLNHLSDFNLISDINKIEKGAFNFSQKSNQQLDI